MIDEIVKCAKDAAIILANIRAIPSNKLEKETILHLLKKVVSLKLMISADDEEQIKKLVIMSIKQQDMRVGNLSDDLISKQIKKYDCHQNSLVAQKKTLLFMFMEKELGIMLSAEEAVEIETMDELAEAFVKHLKEK